MLGDALCRVARIALDVGIFVVDVNAKNSDLAEYYKSFGFVELLDCPKRLIMPSTTLEKMLTSNENLELLELAKIRLKEKDKAIKVNIDDL